MAVAVARLDAASRRAFASSLRLRSIAAAKRVQWLGLHAVVLALVLLEVLAGAAVGMCVYTARLARAHWPALAEASDRAALRARRGVSLGAWSARRRASHAIAFLRSLGHSRAGAYLAGLVLAVVLGWFLGHA